MAMRERNEPPEEDPVAVQPLFDGNVSALPRRGVLSGFVPPRQLVCRDGGLLYLAVLPDGIVGGQVCRGIPFAELLFIWLLPAGEVDVLDDVETYGRTHTVPCRLFWTRGGMGLREVCLRRRGDNECSLTFTAYDARGNQIEPLLHRVLAFTFLCPPSIWRAAVRFGANSYDSLIPDDNLLFDVHHKDKDHGNNRLHNLLIMPAAGAGGHRQLSARER